MQFQIRPEHVPEESRWLCELVGMESYLAILDTAGGEYIYLPKRETLEKPLRQAAILREYDGTNLRQLSRKYGITDRRVRTILKDGGKMQ